MAATRETTPVVLSGSAVTTITAGVIGPTVSLPSAGLVNLLSDPIEVSDLIVTSTVRVSGLGTVQGYPASLIMLKAGRHGLTNGFVPTVSLGLEFDITQATPFVLADTITGVLTFFTRWVFPRPMILRSGEAISGAVALSPLDNYAGITGTITTGVTVRGRRIPKASIPAMTPYPFSSGAFFSAINKAPQELTYQNIFPVPLNVVAVVCNFASIGPSAAFSTVGGSVRIDGPGGSSGGIRRTIIDGPAPLAFAQRRGMEIPSVLMPNESLSVILKSAPINPVAELTAISIMGYREEAA